MVLFAGCDDDLLISTGARCPRHRVSYSMGEGTVLFFVRMRLFLAVLITFCDGFRDDLRLVCKSS